MRFFYYMSQISDRYIDAKQKNKNNNSEWLLIITEITAR